MSSIEGSFTDALAMPLAAHQPPIVTLLLQSGGLRPAASSDCTRRSNSSSNRACKTVFASRSSDPRRSANGFDCQTCANTSDVSVKYRVSLPWMRWTAARLVLLQRIKSPNLWH